MLDIYWEHELSKLKKKKIYIHDRVTWNRLLNCLLTSAAGQKSFCPKLYINNYTRRHIKQHKGSGRGHLGKRIVVPSPCPREASFLIKFWITSRLRLGHGYHFIWEISKYNFLIICLQYSSAKRPSRYAHKNSQSAFSRWRTLSWWLELDICVVREKEADDEGKYKL